MAFNNIPSSLIQVGKPLVQQIFQYLADNDSDLNSRVALIEGAANKIEVFNDSVYNSSSVQSISAIHVFQAQSDFTLTEAKIGIGDISTMGSTSGTLSFDVRKSSSLDFTGDVSVFTTKPSIDFTSPTSNTQSSNAVFSLANQDVTAGDFLKISIDSLPSGDRLLGYCHITLIGEAS